MEAIELKSIPVSSYGFIRFYWYTIEIEGVVFVDAETTVVI